MGKENKFRTLPRVVGYASVTTKPLGGLVEQVRQPVYGIEPSDYTLAQAAHNNRTGDSHHQV